MPHISARVAAAPAALALTLIPVVASPAVASSGSGQTKIVANCASPSYKPSKVTLTCADANANLIHIHYSTWTASRAAGKATLYANDCNPDCAAGTFTRTPVTFVFKAPKVKHGVKVFTKVVVTQSTTYSPGL
jgi:hypothetical protein